MAMWEMQYTLGILMRPAVKYVSNIIQFRDALNHNDRKE